MLKLANFAFQKVHILFQPNDEGDIPKTFSFLVVCTNSLHGVFLQGDGFM